MTQGNISSEFIGKTQGKSVRLMDITAEADKLFFENLEWLNTAEAATYLRKFCPTGLPSVNAIHKLVSKGRIRRRKFAGRLFFKRKELDYLIECSEA